MATKLANWKNRCGLTTETVSINTVGNNPASLKSYIRNRRRFLLSRLRYVLLFGDVSAIVTEQLGRSTTDHYYYTSKDASSSRDCVLPWVSGGRIPVNSLAEANAVVDQIIRYEKTPPCDPDYYQRMSFAAYFQDDRPQDGKANRAYMKTMEGIRNHMLSLGFEVERIYVSNNANPQRYKDGTTVPQEVRDAIVDSDTATERLISETSEGQLVIGHRDHGGEDGWSHSGFTKDDLSSIRSGYPSIFYSINCLTGRFDINAADSFAEAILELEGGAPSLVAATELSGTWRNDSLMKGLFDALWPGVIPTFPGSTSSYAVKHNRLGDVLNYAKSYLLVAHGLNSGVKNHFEIYHVVGDPTLQLWSEEPEPVRLIARVSNDKLNIYTSAVPSDAVITIWNRGKLVKRTELKSRRLSIPLSELRGPGALSPRLRRYVEVCLAAPGYRFTQTRVNV